MSCWDRTSLRSVSISLLYVFSILVDVIGCGDSTRCCSHSEISSPGESRGSGCGADVCSVRVAASACGGDSTTCVFVDRCRIGCVRVLIGFTFVLSTTVAGVGFPSAFIADAGLGRSVGVTLSVSPNGALTSTDAYERARCDIGLLPFGTVCGGAVSDRFVTFDCGVTSGVVCD